jgi:hypothetical protein
MTETTPEPGYWLGADVKNRIANPTRTVKPERITEERRKFRVATKHRVTDPERYPLMRPKSNSDRGWTKFHNDVFRPGEPPNGLKFPVGTQVVYFKLLSLSMAHRNWIPRTRKFHVSFGISERRFREHFSLLQDLLLVENVPIREVECEYEGCREAIVILDLPKWYTNRRDESEDEHFKKVVQRRAKSKKSGGLRAL